MIRSGFKRQNPIERKKRMKRQRFHARKRPKPAATRAIDHLEDVIGGFRDHVRRVWIATRPCLICGSANTYACHTVNGGTAYKGTDQATVPLCLLHHDEYDGRRKLTNGEVGKAAFEAFYRISMATESLKLTTIYHQEMMQPQ